VSSPAGAPLQSRDSRKFDILPYAARTKEELTLVLQSRDSRKAAVADVHVVHVPPVLQSRDSRKRGQGYSAG